MTADELLRELWLNLRDGADEGSKSYVRGAIETARCLGALTDEQAELWRRRINTCPGHDDEGGRLWCAYCGDMPNDDDETEEPAGSPVPDVTPGGDELLPGERVDFKEAVKETKRRKWK